MPDVLCERDMLSLQAKAGSGEPSGRRLAGRTDPGAAELGLWPVLSVVTESEEPSMEPQAGVPDLLRTGAQNADQAKETPAAGDA